MNAAHHTQTRAESKVSNALKISQNRRVRNPDQPSRPQTGQPGRRTAGMRWKVMLRES
jgi:hypothetical protein